MAETQLTIALEGEVSLHDFRVTMARFDALIEALCVHVNREAVVHWDIVDLKAGSATATVKGTSLDHAFIAEVSRIYLDVGKRLEGGQTLPYPASIIRPASQLTHVINGRVTAVRFRTTDAEAAIVHRTVSPEREGRTYALGEVRGTVETLQRRRHRFTLYDELFDQAVVCHLRPNQEEMMRAFWGKEVIVTGEIGRDARSGRPVVVSDVTDIQLFPVVPPGSYERARGVWDLGTDQPELLLRRIRNGGEV
jgi:hypothetical protein